VGDTANKPAAADRDKKSVEVRDLFLDFQTNCPLAEQRPHLIERMDRCGARAVMAEALVSRSIREEKNLPPLVTETLVEAAVGKGAS
jgi:hypothetical protein